MDEAEVRIFTTAPCGKKPKKVVIYRIMFRYPGLAHYSAEIVSAECSTETVVSVFRQEYPVFAEITLLEETDSFGRVIVVEQC